MYSANYPQKDDKKLDWAQIKNIPNKFNKYYPQWK